VKHCPKCNTTKPLLSFFKNKTKKDKLDSFCKECSTKRYNAWRNKNYQKAIEANRQSAAKWRADKPFKNVAKTVRYTASKLNATPVWLSTEQLQQIESFYWLAQLQKELTDTTYHVDHIVPLKGKTVCGLHVPWNLQVIPALENIRKGNKIVL
jgi:hypothetical protein